MNNTYRNITALDLVKPTCDYKHLREWEKSLGMKWNFKNKHYCVWVNFKNYYFKTARKAKLFYKKSVSSGYIRVCFYVIKKSRFNLKMGYGGFVFFKFRRGGKSQMQSDLDKVIFNQVGQVQVFIDEARRMDEAINKTNSYK